MPEEPGKSVQDPSTCNPDLKAVDSQENPSETITEDKLTLDKANSGTSIQKDPDNVPRKEENDGIGSDDNLDHVSNDESDNALKAEHVSKNLNKPPVTNLIDSDPSSEDFVLRYEDSDLSELDKTSDPVNDDSSQNISNDNIIEELDKIIAEDNGNSNLDMHDDSKVIDNVEINQIILPDIHNPVESSNKSPDTESIAPENTIKLSENKSIDKTDKVIDHQTEIVKVIDIKVKSIIAESYISQDVEEKIPEMALMGAGDGFLEKGIKFQENQDNFLSTLEPGTVKIHSIACNQESITKEAINAVLPTTDNSFISGIDEKMDVDEDIAPVLPESDPTEVSNADTIDSIENSTTTATILAADSKPELKDDDQKLDYKMDTDTSDSCNPDIPITSSDVSTSTNHLKSDLSTNIEPTISKSLEEIALQKLKRNVDQDHAKKVREDSNPETIPETGNLNVEEQLPPESLKLDHEASIVANIYTINPDNIANKLTTAEISTNVPKDVNNKTITELIPSLSEQEENALLEIPKTSCVLTEATASINEPKIVEAASKHIAKVESTVSSLTAQKDPDITTESVRKYFKPESVKTAVANDSLGDKNYIENALAQAESNTKVTDQLSVDIPMFSSKKSDMSNEIEPQALHFAAKVSESKDIESQATEIDKAVSTDVIKDQNLEIIQPEMKSMELDLPSSDIVKSDDTKVQEVPKTMSESKNIEAQKAEITEPLSKSTELDTTSDIKPVSKSEDMEIQDSETPKSLMETKNITPEDTEMNITASEKDKSPKKTAEIIKSLTEMKDQEPQKLDMEQLSTQTQLIDTDTLKTISNSSNNNSAAIPEETNLKSPEPSTSKDSAATLEETCLKSLEPCTSKDSESQEMQPDQSDEVPDMTDSLGLLAETFRSMEDGDEQEEDHEEPDDDDGEDGDDDDDFDHDDESNQVPDNSEDSNVATNSETDHDANLAEPDHDANMAQPDHDTNLAEPIKATLLEVGGKIDVVETLAGTVVEAITNIEIEENKVASDIDLGTLEQDDLKLPKTPEALTDIITTKEDVVEKAEPENEGTSESSCLKAILTETQVPAETEKLTPTKAKVLEISKPKNCINIVELEESSSEDDIQEVNRPAESEEQKKSDDISIKQTSTAIPKSVRINTSEITIKTATAESTLVIPEIRVGNVEKSKESKPKCGLEVFSLDSDDDSSGKEKLDLESKLETKQPYIDSSKAGDCVNPTCDATSIHYMKANAAILRYYDVKKKKRKRAVVCENCAYHVGSRMENLMEGVKCCSTRLLSLHMERGDEQLVEISDSDTDSESEDKLPNTVGDSGYSFLESTFADMVNSTWIKYNLATRMADAKDEIVDQIDQLEKDSKEIDEMLNSCQKLTDELRNDLYAAFTRPIHNLPPIDIDENCIVQTPASAISSNNDDSNSETDGQVRRSKRTRTSKDEPPPSKRPAIPLGYKNNVEDPNADTKDDDIRVVRLSREAAPSDLPPPGEFRRLALRVGMAVYGMRHTFGAWSMALIENVAPSDVPNFSTCRVKFENKVKGQFKQLLGRHLAYAEPADVRLTIGTRVIALFIDWSETKKKTSFYSGVIAEVPNPVNLYRYLVFFDDGYAQYVHHADIRVVCETSALVWEEVHTFSREFVKSYLLAYPERPMVRLHAGQCLKTEWNGKWWPSKVLAVDASLVNVYFEADKRTEWIYRGSTRLAPLFLELQAAERPRNRALHSSANRHHKNMPYVEYTRTNEQEDEKATPETQQQQEQEEIKRQRAVAKKSTIQPYQPQPPPSVHQSPSDSVLSRVVYYTPKAAVKPHKMQSHTCSVLCKRTDVLPLNELRTYNPLARPLLSGWERQIVRFRFRKEVVYRAPCGRRLRNVQELHRYLRDTYSEMSVDLFDFNPQTHCLAEFVLNRCLVSKKDLSHGKENVPVPCVNYYDNALPEFCSYNTERTPTQGVPLNTDPEFLCGCDCTDDCQDKSKCACWKLTMEGAKTIGMDDTAGYVYKRLLEPVPSGIYECNSRCKCSKTCLNRVAQHPLQLKLQVFKTLNRGWGIRALNDVPKGAFLCVYAGNLLTDATANLDGLNEGDEYLAELDYIEVVEQMKEGYEDDIPDKDKRLDQNNSTSSEMSEDEEEEEDNEGGSERSKDEDFRPDPAKMGPTQHVFSKRLRKRSRKGEQDDKEKERDKDKPRDKDGNEEDCITISDDEEVRQPSRFNAEAGMDPNEFVSKKRPLRSFFGKDEACYIMDAKVQGNIGRYLNHSCTPNVFVQNVFVDTHDPRFPWVAFFALSHIKAGTELTWNYNYDIGSVPGKVLYCYCGAPNCRRRLL